MEKIEIKCTGTTTIPLEELNIFQGNLKRITKQNIDRLKKSIIDRGYCAPIFVWDRNGSYQLLDGTSRKKALLSLEEDGYDIPEIPVVFILAETEQEAKSKLLAITSSYGEFELDELQSWLDDFEAEEAESFRFVDEENVFEDIEEIELEELDEQPKEPEQSLESIRLTVSCDNPEDLDNLYERLKDEGFRCRLIKQS